MNAIHLAYKTVGMLAAATLVPWVCLHRKITRNNVEDVRQRLGIYPVALKHRLAGRPRLWMHAVSVGEVGAADAILSCLKTPLPPGRVALSVTTRPGFERAEALMAERAAVFYAPIDLDWSNHRALSMVRPDALVLMETEIWPNLILAAHQMGIPVAIVNGRISVRTINYYRKIKPLLRHVLSHVDRLSMISEGDASRIAALGAPRDRIVINGNAKFDSPATTHVPDHHQRLAGLYDLKPEVPVFVAGSTRFPEERLLLDAFRTIRREFPETVMIIAPRHVNRTQQIEGWVMERGWSCERRSMLDPHQGPRKAPVVILDTIGELAATYAIATFVFCGGSLVPKGGQNLLEPAMWSKPVICGPSMEDFAEAHGKLEACGGCVTVHDAGGLAEVAMDWLNHPEKARAVGLAACNGVARHRGAASRHAAVIDSLLSLNF